jgi:hypothetical protein
MCASTQLHQMLKWIVLQREETNKLTKFPASRTSEVILSPFLVLSNRKSSIPAWHMKRMTWADTPAAVLVPSPQASIQWKGQVTSQYC